MNISSLEKFNSNINYYQILYGFLVIIITSFIIIGLMYFKNITKREYYGVVNNNILEISNLTYEEVALILECKKVMIKDNIIKNKIIDIKENNDNYLISIKLNKIYLEGTKIKITYILNEESIYQFMLNRVKGDR